MEMLTNSMRIFKKELSAQERLSVKIQRADDMVPDIFLE